MIATIKQPGRRFGPAPKPRQSRTVEPLTAQQRRLNYITQPGRTQHASLILTPAQYRRLTKKGKGTVHRVWIDEHKRLQAVIYPETGPVFNVSAVYTLSDPVLTDRIA